jgi:serine/threonine protein phosphatase 1
MLPRNSATDTLVFLGDLIDRGPDAPGVVADVIALQRDHPERVICLRGNHEQMMLDFIDTGDTLWLSHVTGGEKTFEQYTGDHLRITTEEDFKRARRETLECTPPEHIAFFRQLPFYYEDEYALYVHAGLEDGQHPSESAPHTLLWSRDIKFFKNYRGKPCVFGHTPTAFLPLRGRVGRHGIYISHSAIGLDTGYNHNSPLSCLSLPDFTLYQTFENNERALHPISAFIPKALRTLRKERRADKTIEPLCG